MNTAGQSRPKVVAIVQARMGSSRLPGKTLLPLGGRSVLANVIARLQRATSIHEVMVATTQLPPDEAIAREAKALGVPVFRGSSDDVLGRYLGAAESAMADLVVRVTADCPLVDGAVADQVVNELLGSGADYASNTIVRRYPRGLDVEVFTMRALQAAAAEAVSPEDREHVTLFFRKHPERFRAASVSLDVDYSHYRWTLDTDADYGFLQALVEVAGITPERVPYFADLVDTLRAHPEIASINAAVRQKPTSLEH